MMKLLVLVFGLAVAAFVGFSVVNAQTPTPTPWPTASPWPTPTPTPGWDNVLDDDTVTPEGAPRTGYGGLR